MWNWGLYERYIKTDRAAWKSLIEGASDRAAAALAEQMMSDSLNKIPKQEGTLRDSGRIEKTQEGERELVWDNVYAGYQWYGMRKDGSHVVKKYTTSGTGKMWVEQARAENNEKWVQVAQNGFTEGLK